MSAEKLDSLAVEELLQEAKRGKERSSSMGTYGWEKRKVSTNKTFLKNTLRGVVTGNRRISTPEARLTERGERVSSRYEQRKRHKDTSHDRIAMRSSKREKEQIANGGKRSTDAMETGDIGIEERKEASESSSSKRLKSSHDVGKHRPRDSKDYRRADKDGR